ncbi:MAG TPA: hypothetical protein VIS74_02330 [Chthoniobacterales bacterium]
MDAVNDAGWDEALSRLLAFLSALEMGGVEQRLRVALRIVDRARNQAPADADPVRVTMSLFHEEMQQWFAQALEDPAISEDRRVALGVVALRLAPTQARWLDTFPQNPPPAELRAALRGISLRTGPDLALSSMTPQEMDFGTMEDIAHETWHQFEWGPLLRAVLIWTAIFFGALAAYNHFFPS